jgi:DNA-binding CsgD family transcriptional regulator
MSNSRVQKTRVGADLSPRETEIVALVCTDKEFSVAEVAAILGISLFTAKQHMKIIHRKLDVKSRVGLTRWAIREGLVTL